MTSQSTTSFSSKVPSELLELVCKLRVELDAEFFLVGGAVRDMVLGETPKDFDVASDVHPDVLCKAVRSLGGYKVLEVGKSFGVVVVVMPSGEEYEFATFREDVGSGRRPDGGVRFSSIETDVLRRDLTMNALFMNMSTFEVVDLVGGLADLEARMVRCVGDASERFAEDPLRVLRAVRFAARFSRGHLEAGTAFAMASEVVRGEGKLLGVSPERVRDEFVKGLKSAFSVRQFLGMLEELGLMSVVFPGLHVQSVSMLTKFSREPALMVAMLLRRGDSSKKVAKVLNELKWSAEEVCQVSFLLDLFSWNEVEEAPKLRKRLLTQARLTREQLVEVSWFVPLFDRFMQFVESEPKFTASEVAEKFGVSGKALGEKLHALEVQRFVDL